MLIAPATGKLLLEDRQLLYLGDVEHSPSSLKRPRPHLIHEQSNTALLDAVIVRLGDAPHALIRKLNEPLLGNSVAQLMIDEDNDRFGARHLASKQPNRAFLNDRKNGPAPCLICR